MTQTRPRYILPAIIIFSLSLPLLFVSPVQAEEPQGRLKLVFEDVNYDFELQRVLGVSVTGGFDINEVLATAHRINPEDEDLWYRQWRGLADRLYGVVEQALKDGHLVSQPQGFSPGGQTHGSSG